MQQQAGIKKNKLKKKKSSVGINYDNSFIFIYLL